MQILDGKEVVMIIAKNSFRDEEYRLPKAAIERAGGNVTTASSSLADSHGMLGYVVKPDMLVRDINIDDFDAVVFVGGIGAAEYWNDEKSHEICREAVRGRKIIGALCIAPVTLANAQVLNGKRATVYPTENFRVEEKGAICTNAGVEIDGLIVTGSGPAYAREFGEAIVEVMAEKVAR
ncbi:MAG: DJ-1/PfpI family protein [Thermoplasmata archaeon]|nr:DJ-1/PfpI family protein [Thermoplasmata archaeon]